MAKTQQQPHEQQPGQQPNQPQLPFPPQHLEKPGVDSSYITGEVLTLTGGEPRGV
jgi:hypothetical protein